MLRNVFILLCAASIFVTIASSQPADPRCSSSLSFPSGQPCFMASPVWIFNSNNGQCTLSVNSNCGGSDDYFHSKEDCVDTCSRKQTSQFDICSLPPANGNGCFAKWTFNSLSGQCESTLGCRRTANLFNTKEDCVAACGRK